MFKGAAVKVFQHTHLPFYVILCNCEVNNDTWWTFYELIINLLFNNTDTTVHNQFLSCNPRGRIRTQK